MKNGKNSQKIIIHLCSSELGSDTRDYAAAGYDVRYITKEIGVENYHPPENTYAIFANPPCTQFSKANWRVGKKDRAFNEGMFLVKECLRVIWEAQEMSGAGLKWWALENPLGYLPQFLGHAPFKYQPWQFGDESAIATKWTCLWGYFNKPTPTILTRTIAPMSKTKVARQLLFPAARTTKEWASMDNSARSNASPFFTRAFYLANP
jgi:hypothetical protein